MDRETAKAIADLSKKINRVSEALNTYIDIQNTKNKSNIDYIAMMADIMLPAEGMMEEGEDYE